MKLLKRYIGKIIVPLAMLLALAGTYYLVFRPDLSGKTTGDAEKIMSLSTGSDGANKPDEPKIKVRRPEVSHLVDGKVTWKLSADSIESDAGSGITRLAKSSGVFFRDKNATASRFEFETPVTIYDSNTKSVRAEGRIAGSLFPENFSLEANDMRWSESGGSLTISNVVLSAPGSSLKCGALEIRPREKTLKLSGGVVAEFKMKKIK